MVPQCTQSPQLSPFSAWYADKSVCVCVCVCVCVRACMHACYMRVHTHQNMTIVVTLVAFLHSLYSSPCLVPVCLLRTWTIAFSCVYLWFMCTCTLCVCVLCACTCIVLCALCVYQYFMYLSFVWGTSTLCKHLCFVCTCALFTQEWKKMRERYTFFLNIQKAQNLICWMLHMRIVVQILKIHCTQVSV